MPRRSPCPDVVAGTFFLVGFLAAVISAAEPAPALREVDLAAVTFVNAAHVEETAEGVIPLRFTPETLAAMGDGMRPIARMATGIELQLEGTIRVLEVTARCRFDDGFGVTAEWFRGPHKQLPTVAFVPGSREPQTFTCTFWAGCPAPSASGGSFTATRSRRGPTSRCRR
jgi:hypothetical protein